MAWIVSHFDDLALPEYNPRKDNSPAPAESALVRTPGGYFDKYGRGNNAPVVLRPIVISGVLWGDPEILVDETGDAVVDESGDTMVEAASSGARLREQLDALGAMVETRGQLWRESMDDGARQFKGARFQQLDAPQEVRDRDFKAHVSCTFEPLDAYWHAENPTAFGVGAASGVATALVVENPGKTVTDAVLSVLATTGTITTVIFACSALGISLTWTGSLDAGETLVIDAGSGEVAAAAEAAFSGFSLGGSARGYIPIRQGVWVFDVTVLGGNASVELIFHAQYA